MFQLPGYDLTSRLHQSRKTFVYKGFRLKDNKPVAVKILRKDIGLNYSGSLKYEFDIIQSIHSSFVIRAIDYFHHSDTSIIVMEETGGESLKNLIHKYKFSLDEKLSIAAKTVKGLIDIHSENIVHKDLNPSNIIYNPENGSLKIIDFGISSQLSKEKAAAETVNRLEGTLAYISPEQTGRMNRMTDYRTDYYSLGAALYELFAGRPPFESDDPMELVYSHLALIPADLHALIPDFPYTLSNLIMKLLSKNAEARYISGKGILSDIEECQKQLAESGAVSVFALGRYDYSGKLVLPEKLYGREKDVSGLMSIFSEISNPYDLLLRKQRGLDFVIVSGSSGIGKSSLVRELQKPIAERKGHFVQGKFGKLTRNVPYKGFISALGELTRHVLSVEESSEKYRRLFREALGENLSIVTEVIPEMEDLLGKHFAEFERDSMEYQTRFKNAILGFLKTFCSGSNPLVIFLDDMQWADIASLQLLSKILEDETIQGLMIICAVRDNELDESHPLNMLLTELSRTGITPKKFRLEPLTIESVQDYLMDSLQADREDIKSLSSVFMHKTDGNPFFMNEMLKIIYERGYLKFYFPDSADRTAGRWKWDIAEIEKMSVTENVADLLIDKIKKLPSESQKVLKLAACIGSSFDLKTLSIIYEKDMNYTGAVLWNAMHMELIYPVGEEYKYLQEDNLGLPDSIRIIYKFTHDKVLQAAYNLLPPESRQSVHLQIGRLLYKYTRTEDLEERLFDIVNHYNLGMEKIESEEESFLLAAVNLGAAKKAMNSVAYNAVIQYCQAGIRCIQDETWTINYKLAYSLHKLRAEAEYLIGHFEKSESYLLALLEKANSAHDKTEIYSILVSQYNIHAEYSKALTAGRTALKLLGIVVPEKDYGTWLLIENEEIQRYLEQNSIESLIDLPRMTEGEKQSAMKLLARVKSTTYLYDIQLYPLIVTVMVRLSLKYGNAPESCFAYSTYGIINATFLNNPEAGYSFAKLAFELSEKFKDKIQKCKTGYILAGYLNFRKEHIKKSFVYFEEAGKAGLESGEIQFTGYNFLFKALISFHSGKKLQEIFAEADAAVSFAMKSNNFWAMDMGRALKLALASYTAISGSAEFYHTTEFSEEKFLDEAVEHSSRSAVCNLRIYKGMMLFLLLQYSAAAKEFSSAKENTESILGLIEEVLLAFYSGLCSAALYKESSDLRESARLLSEFREHIETVKKWADSCPENFQHKYYLMKAEEHFIIGENEEASVLYEKSINLAKENGFLHELGVSYELAGRYYLKRGLKIAARNYLKGAYISYNEWGAFRKTEQLEEEFPNLEGIIQSDTFSMLEGTGSITLSMSASGSLDVLSLFKVTQAISGEIVLGKLLENLVKIMVENSGAEKGYLIMEKKGKLYVENAIVSGHLLSNASTPIESVTALPASVIQFIRRTKESLIIDDAALDIQFSNDPYIREKKPRSILCLPLANQGKLLGIVYLENNLMVGAFPKERLQILKIIASQAAISIENAVLYEHLEEKVAERTKELNDSLRIIKSDLITAKEIQNNILPKQKLKNPAVDYYYEYIPMAEVGGDFIDITEISENHIRVFLSDATGHGVHASLMTMLIKAEYENLRKYSLQPSLLLERFNQEFCEKYSSLGTFFTCCITDIYINEKKILYASCGHPNQYLVNSTGLHTMSRTGNLIGLDTENKVHLQELELETNSRIILFTDGVYEEFNPDMEIYGEERLSSFILKNSQETASSFSKKLISEVKLFTRGKPFQDDVTILVLNVNMDKLK